MIPFSPSERCSGNELANKSQSSSSAVREAPRQCIQNIALSIRRLNPTSDFNSNFEWSEKSGGPEAITSPPDGSRINTSTVNWMHVRCPLYLTNNSQFTPDVDCNIYGLHYLDNLIYRLHQGVLYCAFSTISFVRWLRQVGLIYDFRIIPGAHHSTLRMKICDALNHLLISREIHNCRRR